MPNEKNELIEVISEKINWDDDISEALDYALNLEHADKSKPRSVDVARRVLASREGLLPPPQHGDPRPVAMKGACVATSSSDRAKRKREES